MTRQPWLIAVVLALTVLTGAVVAVLNLRGMPIRSPAQVASRPGGTGSAATVVPREPAPAGRTATVAPNGASIGSGALPTLEGELTPTADVPPPTATAAATATLAPPPVASQPPPDPAPAATSPPDPTPAPAPPAPVDARTVLLADDFDDPAAGKLPRSSAQSSQSTARYADGEYVMEQLDPSSGRRPAAWLPGTYENASLSIDARLEGETAGRYISVGCRNQPNSGSHYRLAVVPDTGQFSLARWDEATEALLTPWQVSPAIRAGNASNHLELTCSGSTIAVRINGRDLASVEDSTYARGALWIGVGSAPTTPLPTTARFDNLEVVER